MNPSLVFRLSTVIGLFCVSTIVGAETMAQVKPAAISKHSGHMNHNMSLDSGGMVMNSNADTLHYT